MIEDVFPDAFTVRLYCLDTDSYISKPVSLPVGYVSKPSLLSLRYIKTTVLELKSNKASGGVATAFLKNSLPFWFQRLPHNIIEDDVVPLACQEGQMLFDDAA